MSTIPRYPLSWPEGWRRRILRTPAAFGKVTATTYGHGKSRLSVMDGLNRVLHELKLLGISEEDVVISTNLRTRLDGLPRSDQAEPSDPGAAVYWETRAGKRQCIAIDIYSRVADNLAAIAATLDAMRAIKRHGGAEILERAFTGFVALPAPAREPETWWEVLGISSEASGEEINAAWRRLAALHHPDRGGDGAQMARINRARDQATGRHA